MSGFNVQLQLAGVLEWMSQQMAGCGGKTAVIGISGGKDSSTVGGHGGGGLWPGPRLWAC